MILQIPTMKKSFLGSLTTSRFLAEYWQKKPLFVPNAFPEFPDFVGREDLMELACREDVQARLVQHKGGKWTLRHGPFASRDFGKLPRGGWSLLVQGLDTILPAASRLLREFNFIPYARLDDIMVSLAPQGGGIGPHFDSYDVFLLQGSGRKRWQISAQTDRSLIPDIPLRILNRFTPTQEWVVGPGDLLYLPPGYAHYGIAMDDDCTTYSVGFRAPSYQELGTQFLLFLEERLQLDGLYEDPDLRHQKHPAELGEPMVSRVFQQLKSIRWDKADVAHFLGCYLTEPKPHVFFSPPSRPLSNARFLQAALKSGLRLALRTLMLFRESQVFINGEGMRVSDTDLIPLQQLADTRELAPGTAFAPGTAKLLYQWYLDGYIELAD